MLDFTFFSMLLGLGLALLAFFCSLYSALILLSPPTIDASPSEKNYLSAKNPGTPQALPDIRHNALEMVDLSVIIPAFNETARLPSMLTSAIQHLSRPELKKRTCEIIIVDDGSTDDTSKLALELARKYNLWDIRVTTLESNLGKGGAVRHGMLHSRGRRLLMVDADGASQFEDLERLWKEMEKLASIDETASAIVIGSRAHLVHTDIVVKRSIVRNLAMYALHVTLRLVGVGHIGDTQCGFKLFTREAARSIFPYQHLTGWIFDVEILLLAKQLSIPVVEAPISWVEVPESKLRLLRDSVLMFKDLLILRANHIVGRWSVPSKLKIQ